MPYSQGLYVFYLIQWVVKQSLNFFSRSVEVFLHVGFGRRYLVGRLGWPMLALHATVMLGSGVFLLAPFELIGEVLAYDPSATEVRRALGDSRLGSVDMRRGAQQAIETLRDTHVTDAAVARGSYYAALAYEYAIRSVTAPFAGFVAAWLALAFHHQRGADGSDRVNEHAGDSHLTGVVPGLEGGWLTGFVEPVAVVLLGFLAWGQVPGSAWRAGFSLDADPVLGHFLMAAGVSLFLKERLRIVAGNQKAEDQASRQRKMGRDPSGGGRDQAPPFVKARVCLQRSDERLSVADALASLSESRFATLVDLPEPIAEQVRTLRGGTPATPGRSSETTRPKRRRIACPACGDRLSLAGSPPAGSRLTCPTCGAGIRIGPKRTPPTETLGRASV